ncbi:MAG: class I SAM-dependent rRNA methyltransferase, partial [Nitrospinota bacterium]
LQEAYDLRVRLYPDRTSYRVVYSEADFLPGLIVDKYEDYLVVQTLTLGMEQRLHSIQEGLERVFRPRGIILRNDAAIRTLEGLPLEKRILKGSPPAPVSIEEGGLSLQVDLLEGQKTGFFFDQHDNRRASAPYFQGRTVLDCFCYTGAWSLTALQAGAREVLGIDSSEKAIALARENAALNGYASRATFRVGDVWAELKALRRQRRRFGAIILDPPAFVKSKQKLREGLRGYLEVNRQSIALLEPGGILITSSCSHHVSREEFVSVLLRAAQKAGRTARLLEMRGQARDHPVLLAAPETAYLKCVILEVR